MKNIVSIFLFIAALLTSCSNEQETYTQTVTSTEGMLESEIKYLQGENIVFAQQLVAGPMTYDRVDDSDVSVSISDVHGTSTFKDIPSKYINLDATVEVTRNVFQDYFPEEWAPMKGQPYTTLYIKSKQDNQVFYMKCVFTNTDKEISKYSEDF